VTDSRRDHREFPEEIDIQSDAISYIEPIGVREVTDNDPALAPTDGDEELAEGLVVTGAPVTVRKRKSNNPILRSGRRFLHNRAAMVGLAFIILVAICALFASFIAPYDPAAQEAVPFEGPSSEHYFGTDDLGRDVFSRIVYGGRVALRVSFQVTAMVLIVAIPLGLAAGYSGKGFDYVVMRVMDAFASLPALVFAIAVAGVLGPGLTNAMYAMWIVLIPGIVRLLRGAVLSVREETFVEASRSIGTRSTPILLRRILPNVASPLIVQVSIMMGAVILFEASLSFVGLGVQPPESSWGQMLRRAYDFIFAHPWQMVAPGLCIALAILSFNLIGDGLRDSLGLQVARVPRGNRRKARLGITSVIDKRPELTAPATESAVLSVRDLRIEFATDDGPVTVVDGVSFDVAHGEVLGLVGESGSGKSMTSLGIMRLIPTPPGRLVSGQVMFDGRDIMTMSPDELRHMRGNDMAMVFQDPMSSLNPAYTVGNQLTEALRLHTDLRGDRARARAKELLDHVGIADPDVRMKEYPHQLSGGMRQRVMIALALSCNPKFLIADEPTTALDVTIQAEILDLMRRLQRENNMSMIFVTHDLGVVADICDRVVVMYAGQVVEEGPVQRLFENPQMPYTSALLEAIPQLAGAGERLASIPGVVPLPSQMPTGCRFGPRCNFQQERCTLGPIPLVKPTPTSEVRCVRHQELVLKGSK